MVHGESFPFQEKVEPACVPLDIGQERLAEIERPLAADHILELLVDLECLPVYRALVVVMWHLHYHCPPVVGWPTHRRAPIRRRRGIPAALSIPLCNISLM